MGIFAQEAVFCHGVRKSVFSDEKEISVLENIGLKIPPGSFTALLGNSGSGKTALTEILLGVAKPDRGQTEIFGTDIFSLPAAKMAEFRRTVLSAVFPSGNLISTLDLEANLFLPYLLAKKQPERQQAEQITDFFGLRPFLASMPDTLAPKTHYTAAIARALIARTKLLLCDDPTWHLSEREVNEIASYLRLAVRDFGMTVFAATSDPFLAVAADTVYLLSEGKIYGQIQNPTLNSVILAMDAAKDGTP